MGISKAPETAAVHVRGGAYRGWWVVLGAFGITFVGFGSAYTFSVFITSLQAAFEASLGSISLVFSLAAFLYFFFGIVSGPLADRFGSRRLALGGMVLTGAGLIAAGCAQNLTTVYLGYGLGVGLGVGLAYVPTLGAVQHWFERQRGLASGLAVSGIGAGTLVMPPLASFLIEMWDWRRAYIALGIGAVIVGSGAALLVANPRERAAGRDRTSLSATLASMRESITSQRFVRLYLACLLGSLALFVPFVHLVPSAERLGLPSSAAIALLSLLGVGSTVGRFVLGAWADRMGRLKALQYVFVAIGASQIIWLLSTEFLFLALFALLFGTLYGGMVAMLPSIVMDDFGERNISALIGTLYTGVAFGTLIGPSAAGYLFDQLQGYTAIIAVGIGTNLLAAFMTALTIKARPPSREHRAEARD